MPEWSRIRGRAGRPGQNRERFPVADWLVVPTGWREVRAGQIARWLKTVAGEALPGWLGMIRRLV